MIYVYVQLLKCLYICTYMRQVPRLIFFMIVAPCQTSWENFGPPLTAAKSLQFGFWSLKTKIQQIEIKHLVGFVQHLLYRT